jgi:hypothetical protein
MMQWIMASNEDMAEHLVYNKDIMGMGLGFDAYFLLFLHFLNIA